MGTAGVQGRGVRHQRGLRLKETTDMGIREKERALRGRTGRVGPTLP